MPFSYPKNITPDGQNRSLSVQPQHKNNESSLQDLALLIYDAYIEEQLKLAAEEMEEQK